jgi:hypothetical protein
MNDVTLSYRHAVEAVDRSLQDIHSSKQAFSGITIILGGDFQQALPVMVKATWEETVQATVQQSHVWHDVSVLHLTQNMCLNCNDQQTQFA